MSRDTEKRMQIARRVIAAIVDKKETLWGFKPQSLLGLLLDEDPSLEKPVSGVETRLSKIRAELERERKLGSKRLKP